MDVSQHRWVAIDGSVYTERKFLTLNEFTGKNFPELLRQPVAFNVGRRVAEQMVRLQNEWYDKQCTPKSHG